MNDKINPIKEVPLRNPGDGLLQRRSIIVEGILEWVFVIVLIFAYTLSEWIRWFRDTPPSPYLFTATLIIISIFAYFRIMESVRKLRNCDIGLLGERHVAEILDDLREHGYRIINDLTCGRMNIDHILIGPAGVFTIETKMARKTIGTMNIISHAKNVVFTNGKSNYGNKAVWQATQEASYLKEIIGTPDQCPKIRPIVVYPGWFVKDRCEGEVWVLNDKYLVQKIRSLPSILSAEEVSTIYKKLETHAREVTAKEDYR